MEAAPQGPRDQKDPKETLVTKATKGRGAILDPRGHTEHVGYKDHGEKKGLKEPRVLKVKRVAMLLVL